MRRLEAPRSADEFKSRFHVSRETLERLETLAALVEKWTGKINLIGKATVPEIWPRHIFDSAQLWPLSPAAPKRWIDLGSGAGFPGLVIAAIAAECSPESRVALVESDLRKSAFLMTAAREMGLKVDLHATRIEDVPSCLYDVISARALAPLGKLLHYADRFKGPDSTCLFLKGATAESELTEARRRWHIVAQLRPSLAEPGSQIIEVQEFSRV